MLSPGAFQPGIPAAWPSGETRFFTRTQWEDERMGQGELQKREALRDSVKMRKHERLNHSVIVTTERPLSLTDNGHGSCCGRVHWV